MLDLASQNAEANPSSSLSSSPKSTGLKSSLLSEHHHVKVHGGGKSAGGVSGRHVRRPHSGNHGRVKKDGAGGKCTWGKLLDTDCASFLDRNDPNYDSGEEEPYELVVSTESDPLDEYKKAVVSIINEYFTTADVQVAVSDIKELKLTEYHPYFIKRLVSMAMDRHNKEKEMASVLLSTVYTDVINPTQISQGFLMLLESADDLAVDILDAADVLALFIARAVVDDILPPAFINKARKMIPEASKGFEVLKIAEKSYLSAPHHAELVERRWGGSTHLTADEVKRKISDLLREYVENGIKTSFSLITFMVQLNGRSGGFIFHPLYIPLEMTLEGKKYTRPVNCCVFLGK